MQPSPEQLGILAIVAFFGRVTRGQIAAFRGGGVLGDTKALRAAGYPSVEAMREVIATQFTPM